MLNLQSGTSDIVSTHKNGGQTAYDAVKHHLQNNKGWQEVREISEAIDYNNDYVRRVAKDVVSEEAHARKRKNSNKRVIGYSINGNLEVPGGDRSALINVLQKYTNRPLSQLRNMSVPDLQRLLRNVANGAVPLGKKLEFRWQ